MQLSYKYLFRLRTECTTWYHSIVPPARGARGCHSPEKTHKGGEGERKNDLAVYCFNRPHKFEGGYLNIGHTIMLRIITCPVSERERYFWHCVYFIDCLLNPDHLLPRRRVTSEQSIQHPQITEPRNTKIGIATRREGP